MSKGSKIERIMAIEDFLKIIEDIKEEQVFLTEHSIARLKEGERNVFKERVIKEYVLTKTPIMVGIQRNGVYAVFYQVGRDLLKVLLDIQPSNLRVVTFHIEDYLPRI